jgi:tetratricopeptide (TPR) repeat protein
MMKYALSERMAHNHASIRGLSCDDDGVFLAGDVPLIYRGCTAPSGASDAPRPSSELEILLASAYGDEWDFSAQIAGLQLIARYMNEEKWALAKIASVHLRLPEISDDLALAKLLATEARYLAKSCSSCGQKSDYKSSTVTRRDVSGEPRVPAGASGGGEWTSDGGYERQLANPLVIPAQAIAPPMPVPLEIPLPPTEVAPFPFALPGAGLRPPPLVRNGHGDIADPVKIITAVSWDRCPKSAAAIRQPRRGVMSENYEDELKRQMLILRTDPKRYLQLAEERILANPDSSSGYFDRYQAHFRLAQYDLALADLDKVLALEPHWIVYESRGNVLRALKRYREALDDYNRAEATDTEEWRGGFGRLYRAECHARLGNEKAALEDCAALRDDHWTPGHLGIAGNKQQVAQELRRLAGQARKPRLI